MITKRRYVNNFSRGGSVAGHSVRGFVDVLARYQVPVITSPAEDLEKEIQS